MSKKRSGEEEEEDGAPAHGSVFRCSLTMVARPPMVAPTN